MKEAWEGNNMSAVVNNRIMSTGLTLLWRGINAAFKFNVEKCNEFLIREKYRAQQANKDLRKTLKRQLPSKDYPSDNSDIHSSDDQPEEKMHRLMNHFFRRNSQSGDKFHWHKPGFRIPCPPPRK